MLMTPQPLYDSITHVKTLNNGPVIFFTPQGKTFTQLRAEKLAAKEQNLILLCGRYEGIDQRIRDSLIDEEISLGKFVLTGGELPAMTLIDAVSRLIPGVIGKDASHEQDSFSKALNRKKEYPHYTRPPEFKGQKVPEVLLSGHHAKIEKWRKNKLK
jgi:tRNA (guanine37-N1)-methyltransferase